MIIEVENIRNEMARMSFLFILLFTNNGIIMNNNSSGAKVHNEPLAPKFTRNFSETPFK
jgi:hypothetical protein